MNVRVIGENNFHKEVSKSSKIILETLGSNNLLMPNNDVISDFIQKYIFISEDSSEIHSKIIRPLLLDSLISSESLAAGSGEICLKVILELIEDTSRKIKSGITLENIEKERKREIQSLKRSLNKYSKQINKQDVINLIDKKFKLNIQKKIAKEIIEKSNIKSPFFLKKSQRRETILSFLSGYNFDIKSGSDFLGASGRWERNNVKVLVIDGMIETVGEIHHLLDRAGREREPIVIFVRSLSDEVRSTISLNLKRGTIDLMPIEVGFDENTLNILNDISICCNSDIVSSYKGDLISSACKKEFQSVNKVIITAEGINILNDSDDEKIKSQLKFLDDKRSLVKENDIKSIFDKRIKSLTSGNIEIKIGESLLREDSQTIEKFDKFFREIKSLVTSGVVYLEDFDNDRVIKHLNEGYPYSSLSIYFSITHAFSFLKSIFSIKRALILES